MWGWILHFTPEDLLSLIVLLSFTLGTLLLSIGLLADKFKILSPLFPKNYLLMAKIGGLAILLFGAWFKGAFDVEMIWRSRAAELKAKLEAAEKRSRETNIVIQEKLTKEIQVVRDVQTIVQEKIVEVEKIIDGKCTVDQLAIDILNQAATNTISPAVTVADESKETPLDEIELNITTSEEGPGWVRGNITRTPNG